MSSITLSVPGGTLYLDPADHYAETWFADTGLVRGRVEENGRFLVKAKPLRYPSLLPVPLYTAD